MQIRYCSADEAGYVTLNGAWYCRRCGCVNEECDVCRQCGWNRSGCQGGVRAAQNGSIPRSCGRRKNGATSCQTAQSCPSGAAANHGVQCCPANTALRPTTTAAEIASCNGAAGRSSAAACPVAAGVGMVYAVDQALGEAVYQPESALRTGTLFPELHKPMNGRCPAAANCSSTGQQSAFAAWDLRLYLDAHPDDAQALSLFAQLAQEAEDPNYATAFLPGGTAWSWTDDPWPWECRPCNVQ